MAAVTSANAPAVEAPTSHATVSRSSTGAAIKHVEVVPVTLEDVFLALTGRALRE